MSNVTTTNDQTTTVFVNDRAVGFYYVVSVSRTVVQYRAFTRQGATNLFDDLNDVFQFLGAI